MRGFGGVVELRTWASCFGIATGLSNNDGSRACTRRSRPIASSSSPTAAYTYLTAHTARARISRRRACEMLAGTISLARGAHAAPQNQRVICSSHASLACRCAKMLKSGALRSGA